MLLVGLLQMLLVIGMVCIFALPIMMIAYNVQMRELRRDGQSTPSLSAFIGIVGVFCIGLFLCVLSLLLQPAAALRTIRLSTLLQTIGAALLLLPGLYYAVLLKKKKLPPTLTGTARAISIYAAILLPIFCLLIPVIYGIRQHYSYFNFDSASARAILARDPNDAGAHYSLAMSEQGAGNLPAAIAELREVVRIEPRNVNAARQLYHLAYDPDGKQEEQQYLAKMRARLTQRPNDGITYLRLAQHYIDNNNHRAALPELQQAVRCEPNNTEALALLAESLSWVGRKAEAHTIYVRLASHDDSIAWAARQRLAKQNR